MPAKANKPGETSAPNARYMVPVVRSTFQILDQLARSGAQSLNSVTRVTGLPKSTVFRVLTTLSEMGYLLRTGQPPTYCVSPKLAELSRPAAWLDSLRQVALPHMMRLRREFGETVNLGQLNLDRVTYLEVVHSENGLELNERKGEWVYAHASAMGKVQLAFSPPEHVRRILSGAKELLPLTPYTITSPVKLAQEIAHIRRRGYSLDYREINILANCVAFPIRNGKGMAIAGISMSGPESRFDPQRNRKAVVALGKAAAAISKEFGISGEAE